MDYLLDCTQLNGVEVGKLQRHGLADNEPTMDDTMPTDFHVNFSGSTGLPKAVVHTLSHHLASAARISPLLQIDENSEWLLALPLMFPDKA